MIKTFDLFAGIGGFRFASDKTFKKYNINTKCVGWSEIDKYCQITYQSNFDAKEDFFIDDIKKISQLSNQNIKKKLPKFDLLFAGFPCQSFSSMGNQKSLDDERGSLFHDIIKILKAIEPDYFILENVRRILTIDNKNTIKQIINELQNVGYKINYIVLDSKDYGIPQTRRRVFFYGFRKNLKKIMPLLEPPKKKLKKTTLDILDKNVDIKYHLSEKILKTIMKDGTGGYKHKSEIDLEIARPLTKTMVKMHRAHQDNYFSNRFILGETKQKWVRKLTPIEAFRLQGFRDNFVKNAKKAGVSDTQLYMQAGNSVTVNAVSAMIEHLINNNWFK